MSGALGVYLFLPLGLARPPGWNDKCVKAALNVARAQYLKLRVADFVDDVRLVDGGGEHDALAAGMTGLMSLFEQVGA